MYNKDYFLNNEEVWANLGPKDKDESFFLSDETFYEIYNRTALTTYDEIAQLYITLLLNRYEEIELSQDLMNIMYQISDILMTYIPIDFATLSKRNNSKKTALRILEDVKDLIAVNQEVGILAATNKVEVLNNNNENGNGESNSDDDNGDNGNCNGNGNGNGNGGNDGDGGNQEQQQGQDQGQSQEGEQNQEGEQEQENEQENEQEITININIDNTDDNKNVSGSSSDQGQQQQQGENDCCECECECPPIVNGTIVQVKLIVVQGDHLISRLQNAVNDFLSTIAAIRVLDIDTIVNSSRCNGYAIARISYLVEIT